MMLNYIWKKGGVKGKVVSKKPYILENSTRKGERKGGPKNRVYVAGGVPVEVFPRKGGKGEIVRRKNRFKTDLRFKRGSHHLAGPKESKSPEGVILEKKGIAKGREL